MIGNRDYAHEKLRGLLYPEKDAADVAQALTNLNFKVSLTNFTEYFHPFQTVLPRGPARNFSY